jgi:arabinofuranosyltransferase
MVRKADGNSHSTRRPESPKPRQSVLRTGLAGVLKPSAIDEQTGGSLIEIRRLRFVYWLVPSVVILVAFLWLTVLCMPYVVDDAFISFRYAENLARGYGPVFNPGDRVEGYTNFLWVVLLAGINVLGGDSLSWSKNLGVLGNLVTSVSVGIAARRWQPPLAFAGFVFVPPILLAVNYGFVLWGLGGLETALFTCLTTVSLLQLGHSAKLFDHGHSSEGAESFAITKSIPFRWLTIAVLLFAFAALTRPDGMVLYMGGMLGWALWAFIQRRINRTLIGSWLLGGSLIILVLWAHTLFRYLYYGDWVPNTTYIKVPPTAFFDVHWMDLLDWAKSWGVLNPDWLTPIDQLTGGITSGLQWWKQFVALVTWPALWLMILGFWNGRQRPWVWIMGVAILGWFVYLGLIYDDWMPGWRFYVPIVPISSLLITAGLADLAERARGLQSISRRWFALGAVVATVLALITFSLSEFRNRYWEVTGSAANISLSRIAGEQLRKHASPESTLAVVDAGALPYYSGLYTIDYGGLSDKHMAKVPYRPITLDKGDGILRYYPQLRFDPDYLLERKPDFVQLNGRILGGGGYVN